MDRYLTMAIFVLILVVSIGSANSYFLEKQKAMRAKQKQPPKIEKVQQPKKIAKAEEEELLEEEEFVEEEESYYEEEPITPVYTPKEERIHREKKHEVVKVEAPEPQVEKLPKETLKEVQKEESKKEKSKKIDLSKIIVKKEKTEQKVIELDPEVKAKAEVLKVVSKKPDIRQLKEIDGVPIENLKTCKVSKDNRVAVPCRGEFEFIGNCSHIVVVSEGSDSQAKEYLGSKSFNKTLHGYMEASSDGYEMSLALAEKVCKAKFMRVPTSAELYHVYLANKDGCGDKFKPVRYWSLDGEHNQNHTFCNMSNGKCLRRKNPQLEGVLHRVRCVE